MAATLSFSPFVTTNAAGSFSTSTTGWVQGTLLDSPTELFKIAGGYVASTETYPMYGGIAITEDIATFATNSANNALGNSIARATTVSNWTGFTVFNMDYAMVNSPQSPVPLSASGGQVDFVRKGSNTRLAVACDPSIVGIEGDPINQQVSWDFNNQVLTLYDASTGTVTANSATWSANVYQLNVTTSSLPWTPVAGDLLNVSGATNTGSGGNSVVNGNFPVISTSVSGADTLINLSLPAGSGVVGTIGGTIVINFGTGALPVQVLGFDIGESMTVSFNTATGFANWNRSGSTAVIVV